MTFKELILDLTDDDYTGLWELVWRARTTMPERGSDNLISELCTNVEELVRNGSIGAFRGTTFTGEEKPLVASDSARLLADPRSWQPEEAKGIHVRLLTTGPNAPKRSQ